MKSLSIYIIFIISVLTSCKKSFLEVPDQTSLNTGIYFSKQSDFEQAANGMYSPLRDVYSNANYFLGETRSDNSTYVFNSSDRSGSTFELLIDFLEDNTGGQIASKYSNDYVMIARANQILSSIDKIAFDETIKNNIKGQALFLRAFLYFDLVQYFGAVPLHLEPAQSLQQTALPKSSVDDIYKLITSDCEQAIQLLPERSGQEAGKPSKGTARMLLGNAYIVRKNWSAAETVLKAVSGYQLLPDYASVYDPGNKNNLESLFEIQYKEGAEGFSSNFFYAFIPTPITAAELTAVTKIPEVFKPNGSFNTPTPDIIAAYEAGDKRREASIGNILVSGRSLPYIKKYDHQHSVSGRTNDNFPVYRYSETLLFIAEALNEQAKTNEAFPFINQVRVRAGLPPLTGLSQTALREAIIKERRVELAFENKRWLDLVRTGTAENVMKAYGARVKATPTAYYFPAGIGPAPNSYTNIQLLYPIPAGEVALNPQLR